jgi:hypothetical protein
MNVIKEETFQEKELSKELNLKYGEMSARSL